MKRVDTGELLAAKVINKKSLMSPTQRQRVLNEIDVHSLVSDHPNILKFKGSFRVGDQICILSELCSRNVSNFNFLNLNYLIFLKFSFLDFGSLCCKSAIFL